MPIDELNILENDLKTFNELDYLVTDVEIEKCVPKLKNGKASGNGAILHEMIKCSIGLMIQPLKIIFNKILNIGKFPRCWTDGIIKPLHKKGDTNDPTNYHGIAISSCLGKLF